MMNKITPEETSEIDKMLPTDITLEKCLIYFLAKYGRPNNPEEYAKSIRVLYRALIFGRIGRDLRKDAFLEEVKLHAEKAYDSVGFNDDCPIGEMIKP